MALALPSQELVPGEEKAKAQVAKPWVAFATWCLDHRQKAAGEEAVEEALRWDPASANAKGLRKSLAALPPEVAPDPKLDERRREAAALAAKALDRLVEVPHGEKEAERFEGHLFRALELDPADGKRLERFRRHAAEAAWKGRTEAAGRLIARAPALDPDGWNAGRWKPAWTQLARRDAALLACGDHPLVAWVALPEAETKGPLPVLVAVEGAGCNFLGAVRHFRGARGKLPFILVVPCTLSNTNALEPAKYPWYPPALLQEQDARRMEFDGAGLRALLAVLRREHEAAETFYMTGFSGGGQLTWWWILQRPEDLAGAAPACGNFGGAGAEGAKPPPGGGPPVHVFIGAKDEFNDEVYGKKPGLLEQNAAAEAHLARLGFTRVRRTEVPGAGHSSMAPQVFAWIQERQATK